MKMTSFLSLYFVRLHRLSMCKELIRKVRRADKSVNMINMIKIGQKSQTLDITT